MILQYTNMAYG